MSSHSSVWHLIGYSKGRELRRAASRVFRLTIAIALVCTSMAFWPVSQRSESRSEASEQGRVEGTPQGTEQVALENAEQGAVQGTGQSVRQGAEQDPMQGAEQGAAQGTEQGAAQDTIQDTLQDADQGTLQIDDVLAGPVENSQASGESEGEEVNLTELVVLEEDDPPPGDYFQLVVNVTAGQGFTLPTSSLLSNNTASRINNWHVNWGDGTISPNVVVNQSNAQNGVAKPAPYSATGLYTITIIPAGSTEAWLSWFGFYYGDDGANVSANKQKVYKVLGPLAPNMTRTSAQLTAGAPSSEWSYAFYNCTNLVEGPSTRGWDAVTTVGDGFLHGIFHSCTSLTTLHESFTLPQNLTTAGSPFASNMFTHCTSLAALPEGFNLPQDLVSVGNNFAYSMFSNCTSLASLPAAFSLPKNLSTVGEGFAFQMFSGAGNSSFQINEGFEFPALPLSETAKTNVLYQSFLLSPNAPLQNRTAAELIGSCTTPSSARQTFGDGVNISKQWSDQPGLAAQWGGLGLTDYFQFEVTVGAANRTFSIPASGSLGGSATNKTNRWNIIWGDGTVSNNVTITQTAQHPGVTKPGGYTNAGSYLITITPAGSSDAWLSCFGFNNGTVGANADANKQKITKVYGPITPNMTRASTQIAAPGPSREWAYAFYSCINLTQGPQFMGWEEVTSVGDSFMAGMFINCANLTSLPEGFNLPQNLVVVGASFAENLFYECSSLTSLPSTFTLPSGIDSAGESFCRNLFYYCESLTELPSMFNLPQELTHAGNDFARNMVGGCAQLRSLPEGFTLPQNLVVAGDNLAYGMFSECTSLSALPDSFNLPQSLTDVGAGFAYSMFSNCTALVSLPAAFTFPQQLDTIGANFANGMFSGAGSASFQFNEAFVFPPLSQDAANTSRAFTRAMRLSPQAPLQNRTAVSIINGCPAPADARETFGDGASISSQWSDQPTIAVNWGGLGLADYFQFEVTVGAEDLSFSIPASSNLGGSTTNKINHWNINWGDGTTSPDVTVEQGASHVGVTKPGGYATAGSYTITITPAGLSQAWLSCFGFSSTTLGGANVAENRAKITKVYGPIVPNMTRTAEEIIGTGPTREWSGIFQHCPNLVEGPRMSGWEEVVHAGDSFGSQLFFGCKNLTTLPEGFTLPENLVVVGGSFAFSMFQNCTSLTGLPAGFNLPQKLTTTGSSFAPSLFQGCTSLATLPEGFNFPPLLTTNVGGFAFSMFEGCTGLATLPAGFNLPQQFTSVGPNFARYLFKGCTSLQALPEGFTFPQSLSTVGDAFAYQMFYNTGGASFQVSDVTFPALSKAEVSKNLVFSETFLLSNQAPPQQQTARSIINGCAVPNTARQTFGDGVNVSAHWSDQPQIHRNWGGLSNDAILSVELTLETPHQNPNSFMVEVTRLDTSEVYTKLLTVPAGASSARFSLIVEPGEYSVETIAEGGTWRYGLDGPEAISLLSGDDVTATLSASLISSQWLSDVQNVRNVLENP